MLKPFKKIIAALIIINVINASISFSFPRQTQAQGILSEELQIELAALEVGIVITESLVTETEIAIAGLEEIPKITVLISATKVVAAETQLIAAEVALKGTKEAFKSIQTKVKQLGDTIVLLDNLLPGLEQLSNISTAALGVPVFVFNPIILRASFDTVKRTIIEDVNDYERRIVIMEEILRDLRGRVENLKQDFLKILTSILKRQLLNYMQNQIIDWIQGGGTPLFVTDWEGFMLDAANRAAGDFAQEIGSGFMCDPFALQVQLALFPVKKFPEVAGCTLDDIVGNINNFIDDFNSGGWIAYNTAWQPQNNFFGLVLMGWNERSKRVAAALEQDVNEAIAGSGFLNQKKCEKDANGKDIPGTCKSITPGTVVGETVKQAVGADFDFIVNADDISDFVESIVNALLNRLITEGVGALKKGLYDDKEQGGSTKFIRQFR